MMTAGDRGPLFGRPLSDLCSQDGTVPQPIQWELKAHQHSFLALRKVCLSQGLSPAQQCPLLSPAGPAGSPAGAWLIHGGDLPTVTSECASREIREVLDSGMEVQLQSQPVHLLSIILKDFLSKIPSQLLQTQLCQQWMDALQKTSRQERLAGLKE
ncbi:hypothetical protein Q9233_008150 [Columba guinea]|nr:hypothetical protein Q9233_008150 [Columba guinea]